ncbi:unnamed protein product [Closterium sp. NIES-53]
MFSWLVFGKTKDAFPYVKCSVCMSYGKENTRYARPGDDGGRDLQTQPFRAQEHTDTHTAAIERQMKIAKGITNGQQVFSNFINSDIEGRLAMVHSISTYLTRVQMDHIQASPFFGISCDESTDRTRGKHMIVNLTFLKNRRVVTDFFTLLTVEKCDAASLFEVLLNQLCSSPVDVSKIVGVSMDGASVMLGKANGLVAWIREHVPHLFSCHCIAHGEALAVKDAATSNPDLDMVDKVVRTVAAELGKSCVWSQRFKQLDVTEISKTIECTTMDLTERYLENKQQFGGESKCWLVGFLQLHGYGGGKKVRVRGVDGEGHPINHMYTMHERSLPGHKYGRTYAECVKPCRDCVDNLNKRLDDLQKLGLTKLFRAGKWLKIKAQWERKCRECNKLFRNKLSGFDLKLAERDLLTFCVIMETHHELEIFTQGLTKFLGSPDSKRKNVIKYWVRGALCNARLGELMQISLLKYNIDWLEALDVRKSMRRRRPAKSTKLAMAERNRKGKAKEGEDEAGAAGQNDEEEGDEEEEEEDVEQDLGLDQELVGEEEEEDSPFQSDDEDVEEVFHIDKPVH